MYIYIYKYIYIHMYTYMCVYLQMWFWRISGTTPTRNAAQRVRSATSETRPPASPHSLTGPYSSPAGQVFCEVKGRSNDEHPQESGQMPGRSRRSDPGWRVVGVLSSSRGSAFAVHGPRSVCHTRCFAARTPCGSKLRARMQQCEAWRTAGDEAQPPGPACPTAAWHIKRGGRGRGEEGD